jgi:hypothetical protein
MNSVADISSTSGDVGADPFEKKAKAQRTPDPALAFIQREEDDPDEALAASQYKEEFIGDLKPLLGRVGETAEGEKQAAEQDKRTLNSEKPRLGEMKEKSAGLKGEEKTFAYDPKEDVEKADQMLNGEDVNKVETQGAKSGEEPEDPTVSADMDRATEEMTKIENKDEKDVTEAEVKAAAEKAKGLKPKKKRSVLKRLGRWFVRKFGKVKKRAKAVIDKIKMKLMAKMAEKPLVKEAIGEVDQQTSSAESDIPAAEGAFDEHAQVAGSASSQAKEFEKALG